MSRLLLVRHGQSDWNAEGRIQGQSGAGLSDLGRRQAEAVASAVADERPDARLVSSDLQRCQQTAAPLAARLGHEPELEPRLRERAFGAWEGRRHAEVASEDAERWTRFARGEEVIGEIGGETAAALADRVVPVLRALLDGEDDTVAVTHGGPIWQGVHAMLSLPPAALGPVGNTSVTELVRVEDTILLTRYNELGHLPAVERSVLSGVRAAASAPPTRR